MKTMTTPNIIGAVVALALSVGIPVTGPAFGHERALATASSAPGVENTREGLRSFTVEMRDDALAVYGEHGESALIFPPNAEDMQSEMCPNSDLLRVALNYGSFDQYLIGSDSDGNLRSYRADWGACCKSGSFECCIVKEWLDLWE